MRQRHTGTSAAQAVLSNLGGLPSTHRDLPILSRIATCILRDAGGEEKLKKLVGELLRDCIDGIIKSAKTGRRFHHQLEKTEKTHIGTCVEIDFRNALELARGQILDLLIVSPNV